MVRFPISSTVTLSEAKGLAPNSGKILRFAQNDGIMKVSHHS